METYPNRKLLLSELMAVDSVFTDRGIPSNIKMTEKSIVLCEVIRNEAKRFVFNSDISLELTTLEARRQMKHSSAISSTNPICIMGPEIYISYSLDELSLVRVDFMFGESLPINYYLKYIIPFNHQLESISGRYELPQFPIKASRRKTGYFRYWVFQECMTALYYPDHVSPRYDCRIEEYYRSDDCGINLLLEKDQNKIVAVDGWMRMPDDLKTISNRKLMVYKE